MSDTIKKIQIQLPTYYYDGSKADAISAVRSYINSKKEEEFTDREEINIRYKSEKGEDCITTATVISGENEWNLTVALNDLDTVKIIEQSGTTAPSDKDAIWLSDFFDEEHPTENFKQELIALREEVKWLRELVNKHDYALSSTIAGGDMIVNSEKYDEENENPTQIPDTMEYEETFATDNLVLNDYDFYLGNTPLMYYIKKSINLWKGQKYFLELRMFNSEGERIIPKEGECELDFQFHDEVIEIDPWYDDKIIMIALHSGSTQLEVTRFTCILTYSGETYTKEYQGLYFEYSQEIDYETYSEPNVHHMLIKKADTHQILEDNTNYVCVNEFVWCIGNNTLYLKAKGADGNIHLFAINGTGSTPVTGETIEFGFDEETGDLLINSDAADTVYIDDEGYLVINAGATLENNILILNDE